MSSTANNTASALQTFGDNIVQSGVALVCETLLYGMYLILIFFSTYTLCRKGFRSAANVAMLVVTLTMFAMSTTLWASELAILIQRVRRGLVTRPDLSVPDNVTDAAIASRVEIWLPEVFFSFEFVLGDSVVIWRAWALWQDNIKVLLAPLCLAVASALAAFALLGCGAKAHFGRVADAPALCHNSEVTSWVLSIAANVIATGIIGYKAWEYRQFIRKSLGSKSRRTQIEKVLALLVDSGAVYFVLWVPQILGFFPITFHPGPAHFTSVVFGSVCKQIVGLYPTIVVVLVNLHRSVLDSPNASHTHARAHHSDLQQTNMRFASVPGVAASAAVVTETGIGSVRRSAVIVDAAQMRSGVGQTEEHRSSRSEDGASSASVAGVGEKKAEGSESV
ncbi:hypothetical protein HETIRDRAFT_452014 [Heterobasidion irregulare TC 32-1]|uniref:Uncharacterized protein n=1 Tax=Heterobasidion irregulare (strain TC 32-1) TaxID=747525 RepID=W4K3V2_HETIT|nr:uncharacterized protein HETIRDRAFT_452014 [Heterobasidion irregulare TC 32-1]ETW80414.1 hypothetical protein HETIRDRAFT_452014 [Heterobasidion irregulare TC 32-1]